MSRLAGPRRFDAGYFDTPGGGPVRRRLPDGPVDNEGYVRFEGKGLPGEVISGAGDPLTPAADPPLAGPGDNFKQFEQYKFNNKMMESEYEPNYLQATAMGLMTMNPMQFVGSLGRQEDASNRSQFNDLVGSVRSHARERGRGLLPIEKNELSDAREMLIGAPGPRGTFDKTQSVMFEGEPYVRGHQGGGVYGKWGPAERKSLAQRDTDRDMQAWVDFYDGMSKEAFQVMVERAIIGGPNQTGEEAWMLRSILQALATKGGDRLLEMNRRMQRVTINKAEEGQRQPGDISTSPFKADPRAPLPLPAEAGSSAPQAELGSDQVAGGTERRAIAEWLRENLRLGEGQTGPSRRMGGRGNR
jgi:hypothetical protein